MIEECRMHGLTHGIVASECKGKIRYTTGCKRSRKVCLYPSYGFYEVYGIFRMFLDAGSDRQYVHIEYDVFGRQAGLFGKQSVSPSAYFNLSVICRCLSLFVKRHHDHCGTERLYRLCLGYECFFSFFQAYGIDYAFALGITKSRQDRLPM